MLLHAFDFHSNADFEFYFFPIAGTGIGLNQVAPPPPPAANLAYKKSGESSNGVMAMIDLIVADVDKEIQEMEVNEKDAQKDQTFT